MMTLGTFYSLLVLYIQVTFLSSQSIRVPGDVVAGRPFTLECKITRPMGDRSPLFWDHTAGQILSRIYFSRECNSSIPVLPAAPAGLSGGCQHVNGEEVYTVRIENVTEDMGRVTWRCEYGRNNPASVILDIKVMVTRVILTNPPGTLTAGVATTFTCVTSASKPQACISCYIRSSGNVRQIGPTKCNPETSSVQITTRTLYFRASAEENGAELYCDASNSVTNPPVRSQVYILDVHYSPNITCIRVQLRVFEGQKVKVSCNVTSNGEVNITWRKDGGQVAGVSVTNSRLSESHVTRSTMEFVAEKALSGTYQITATNTLGTSTSDIRITVIECQFIPQTIHLETCINNKASVYWASGIDESLVEFYKLEYRGTEDIWEERLVRNPGRIKLVKTTVTDLQTGVLYRFRLQPNLDLALSSYAYANCTVTGPDVCEKEAANSNHGLSKGGMLGVGIVVGVSLIALIGTLGMCVLLRRGKLTWHKEMTPQTYEDEPPPMGHYEDLSTSHNQGPQYEDMSVINPATRRSEQGVYENATSL